MKNWSKILGRFEIKRRRKVFGEGCMDLFFVFARYKKKFEKKMDLVRKFVQLWLPQDGKILFQGKQKMMIIFTQTMINTCVNSSKRIKKVGKLKWLVNVMKKSRRKCRKLVKKNSMLMNIFDVFEKKLRVVKEDKSKHKKYKHDVIFRKTLIKRKKNTSIELFRKYNFLRIYSRWIVTTWYRPAMLNVLTSSNMCYGFNIT